MNGLLLALATMTAGGIGSALRYLVDSAVTARLRPSYPWGTTVVNLSGSFVLGLLTGLAPTGPWGTVAVVGLLGGYTTFSTASLETIRLAADGRGLAAVANGAGMAVACIALAAVGIAVTHP